MFKWLTDIIKEIKEDRENCRKFLLLLNSTRVDKWMKNQAYPRFCCEYRTKELTVLLFYPKRPYEGDYYGRVFCGNKQWDFEYNIWKNSYNTIAVLETLAAMFREQEEEEKRPEPYKHAISDRSTLDCALKIINDVTK